MLCTWRQDRHWQVCTNLEELKKGPSSCCIQESNLGHWISSTTCQPTSHKRLHFSHSDASISIWTQQLAYGFHSFTLQDFVFFQHQTHPRCHSICITVCILRNILQTHFSLSGHATAVHQWLQCSYNRPHDSAENHTEICAAHSQIFK